MTILLTKKINFIYSVWTWKCKLNDNILYSLRGTIFFLLKACACIKEAFAKNILGHIPGDREWEVVK